MTNTDQEMSASRTISVLTTNPSQIAAYLYPHTVELDRERVDERTTRVTLVTSAESEERAAFLAQYQADRLSSGWHSATVLDQ
jgi:hypothetical protein